jgi:hypothetical protein
MALDRTTTAELNVAPVDQSIAKTLLIPFAAAVLDMLADDTPQMARAEQNHLADAFRLRRSNESHRVGVGVCLNPLRTIRDW